MRAVVPPSAARVRPAVAVVVHDPEDLADADVTALLDARIPVFAGLRPGDGAGSAGVEAEALATAVRSGDAAALAAHVLGPRALALLAR